MYVNINAPCLLTPPMQKPWAKATIGFVYVPIKCWVLNSSTKNWKAWELEWSFFAVSVNSGKKLKKRSMITCRLCKYKHALSEGFACIMLVTQFHNIVEYCILITMMANTCSFQLIVQESTTPNSLTQFLLHSLSKDTDVHSSVFKTFAL